MDSITRPLRATLHELKWPVLCFILFIFFQSPSVKPLRALRPHRWDRRQRALPPEACPTRCRGTVTCPYHTEPRELPPILRTCPRLKCRRDTIHTGCLIHRVSNSLIFSIDLCVPTYPEYSGESTYFRIYTVYINMYNQSACAPLREFLVYLAVIRQTSPALSTNIRYKLFSWQCTAIHVRSSFLGYC